MARLTGSPWSVPAGDVERAVGRVAAAGLTHVHWDATDGLFAAHGGFDADGAAAIARAVGVGSEAHLMMLDPVPAIPGWAGFCELIVVPVEIDGWRDAVRAIESSGATPALAVSPQTALGRVPHGDFPVLVMSVEPGDAGADFRPGTIERIERLAGRGCHAMVGVDGGVLPAHLPALAEAGATWVVSGTSLFGAPDPGAWLRHASRVMTP